MVKNVHMVFFLLASFLLQLLRRSCLADDFETKFVLVEFGQRDTFFTGFTLHGSKHLEIVTRRPVLHGKDGCTAWCIGLVPRTRFISAVCLITTEYR